MATRFTNDSKAVPLVEGTVLRDYTVSSAASVLFPYTDDGASAEIGEHGERHLWHYRQHLASRRALSGTQEDRGLTWFEFSDFHTKRWAAPFRLGFAFVATHNHVVL